MENYQKIRSWVEYQDGFKYQISKDYSIQTEIVGYDLTGSYITLSKEGVLTLKSGYASDGPSGLTVDTRNSIRAAFVHDAFYYLIRNGYIDQIHKPYIDLLFKQILIEDGMWWPRAEIWYWGVKTRGTEYLYPSKERPILRAP